ncbi:MAG: ABC transporter permease subunit [Rhizobiales bacterium]|nr:ABC transporter permease subunit [Hyphomicrobiales bacterium]
MKFDWNAFFEFLPRMLEAAVVTVEVSVLALGFACLLAPPLAVARMIGPLPLRLLVAAFVEVVRGIPPLLVISFVYFGLPAIGLVLNGFWTGVAALTIVGAVYAVEIIRSAIDSLGRGQREAALALGFPLWRTYLELLFPQALKRILPPLTNELANVIKASALLSVISVHEIAQVGNALIFETFVVVEIVVQMTLLYLVIVGVLSHLSRTLERRLAH